MTSEASPLATIALGVAALAAPAASARPAEDPPAATTKATSVQQYPTRPAQGSQANPRPQVTTSVARRLGHRLVDDRDRARRRLLAIGAIAGVTVRTRQSARSRITA